MIWEKNDLVISNHVFHVFNCTRIHINQHSIAQIFIPHVLEIIRGNAQHIGYRRIKKVQQNSRHYWQVYMGPTHWVEESSNGFAYNRKFGCVARVKQKLTLTMSTCKCVQGCSGGQILEKQINGVRTAR